jgi:cytochrome c551/c552
MKVRTGMGRHLLGVATLGIALGSVAPPAGAAEEHPGRAVFVSKGCATCHEERAVLQAPHLSVLRRDRSLFEFAAGMWNHAPLMWANLSDPGLKWPRLSPREMADLGSYLNGSDPSDPPPNRGRGQLVLVSKGCLTCHALGGPRGTAAKDLAGKFLLDSDAAWAAAMWNHTPTMIALGTEKGIEYPSLEWKDMVDLIGFLRAGHTAR